MTKARTNQLGMTEDENFIVKAAMQLGFEFVDGDTSTMQVSTRNLIAFVHRIEAAERIGIFPTRGRRSFRCSSNSSGGSPRVSSHDIPDPLRTFLLPGLFFFSR